MARFDVYRNPDRADTNTPYYLEVQTSFVHGFDTTVVVPLRSDEFVVRAIEGLNPAISVLGADLCMDTAALGAVPRRVLRSPIGNASAHHSHIVFALDTLFGDH